MITPLLIAFLGLQQGSDQTLQHVQQLERQVGDLQKSVDQLRNQMPKESPAVCAAEVRWLPGTYDTLVDPQKPVALSVLSMVSAPADCLGAEVKVTANYYDAAGLFVCSGSVALTQTANVQNIFFEFLPLSLEYFAKWRDGPTWDRSSYHLLTCYDYEGTENREPGARAVSVKLFATVLPRRGGIASSEINLRFPPPNPTTNRLR